MPDSVNLSGFDAVSVRSSLSGAAMDALVQRRSALRVQLATVENELAKCTPSTSAPPVYVAEPTAAAPTWTTSGKAFAPAVPAQLMPVPPREGRKGASASRTPPPPVSYSYSSAEEASLPGAMRPGRYAFWPKRLPGSQSRQVAQQLARARNTGRSGGGGSPNRGHS